MRLFEPSLNVKIRGVGRAWPKVPATHNLDILRAHPDYQGKSELLLQRVSDTLKSTYGFETRYLTHKAWEASTQPEETSESLSLRAVQSLLSVAEAKDSSFRKESISAFILGSTTSARYTGSQSASVLGKMGVNAPAFDLKAGCSTSLVSLYMAQALIAQGHENVLVSCAETLSKVMHPGIRETWVGLADGAAALWIEKNDIAPDFTVLKSFYSTDGAWVDLFTVPGALPPTLSELERGGYFISGDSSELKKQAQARYRQMLNLFGFEDVLDERVQWVIPHQVNRSLIMEFSGKVPVIWHANEFGNLGGSSVLFSLADSIEKNIFRSGDRILLISVGGGLSFAAQLWQKT